MIRFILALTAFLGLSVNLLAQFGVHTFAQHNSNRFFSDTDTPFTSYPNCGLGGSYQSGGFQVHASITETFFNEALHSEWKTSQQGSFGSTISSYTTKKSADVSLNYLGCRVGMDYVFNHAHRVNLLMGISFQSDRLVSNEVSNYKVTSSNVNYDYTYVKPAVEALDRFYYWNIQIRPRCFFLPNFYVELQVGLSFYYDIRVTNNLISGSYDGGGGMGVFQHNEPYYVVKTRGFLANYFANELGFSIGYRFNDKNPTANKTPTPR